MSDPGLFYCLVYLGRDGNLEPPEVYSYLPERTRFACKSTLFEAKAKD